MHVAKLAAVIASLAVSFALSTTLTAPDRAYAAAPSAEEKQAFESAKELGTIDAWNAFLANYPNGFQADLARAYIKKLNDARAPAPVPAPNMPAQTQGFDYPMIAGSWGGIVRSGPGENYERVTSLKEGEEVVLMGPGVPVRPNDYPWFKIAYSDSGAIGYMWGGLLCSTGAERPDLFKLCTFTPVRSGAASSSKSSGGNDSGSGTTKKKTKKKAVRRDCPGDSVWKNGRCEKEEEPDYKPPINCTGGRLYSLSQERCVCADGLAWNGQRCTLP